VTGTARRNNFNTVKRKGTKIDGPGTPYPGSNKREKGLECHKRGGQTISRAGKGEGGGEYFQQLEPRVCRGVSLLGKPEFGGTAHRKMIVGGKGGERGKNAILENDCRSKKHNYSIFTTMGRKKKS